LGVTKPFIYYHFKNKTELLDEICVEATATSGETLEAAIANNEGPIAQLRAAVGQLVLEVIANQAGIAICFREGKYISAEANQRLEANRRHYDLLLNDLIARGQKEGAIDVPDAQVAGQVLTGAITWSFVWYREDGRLKPEEFADQIVDLALSMVNATR